MEKEIEEERKVRSQLQVVSGTLLLATTRKSSRVAWASLAKRRIRGINEALFVH